MNDGLPSFREGVALTPQLTAKALNSMVSAIRRNRIVAGPNQLLTQTNGGTQVWDRRTHTPPPILQQMPWKMRGLVESGPVYKIFFAPAQVNNFVPKIGSTFIDDPTPPGLTVTGSAGVTYARATIDTTGAITDLIVDSASTLPSDTTSGTLYKYRRIGSWAASGGVFTAMNTILNTNQTFRMCGGSAEWY
jgi:hypothetical protein